MEKFSIKNYPKAYSNIRKGIYLLRKYRNKDSKSLSLIENSFWLFLLMRVNSGSQIKQYKNYKFIDSGWEWSVFLKNERTVIKIPSGIFDEVNTNKYLINTKYAYKKIMDYYPSKYIARSSFIRENNLNLIEQEYIKGKRSFIIGYNTRNVALLKNLLTFLKCTVKLLKDFDWIPDFDIRRAKGGFVIRNVIFEHFTYLPKIIDFTSYYNVFRLYESRRNYEVMNKERLINDLYKWIQKRILRL